MQIAYGGLIRVSYSIQTLELKICQLSIELRVQTFRKYLRQIQQFELSLSQKAATRTSHVQTI